MGKYDGHACVVNTKLYEQVKDKVSGLRGCHADTGEMNQEAFFAISDYVTNSISVPQLLKNMQKAIDYIDWKQNFYDDVLSGKIEYHSNLISDEEIAQKAQ